LLVGTSTFDDAGVYKLRDDLAIVQTVDYFTPIVDDPYAFGQIAAANAMSDVYAMGGVPITVLNIVGYPITKLPPEILAEILRGGADKVREAGAVILGGHSIDDKDPKFGLAVTGTVHPDKIWTNTGAKQGDVLILTKPLGAGVITTGIKRGLAADSDIETVTKVMATLNKAAAEVAKSYTIHACTDVTGFGFLGHALEMAKGSGVHLSVSRKAVPILQRARYFAEEGSVPGGTKRNLTHVLPDVRFDGVDEIDKTLLSDSITSGGLLLSVPAEQAEDFVSSLHAAGVSDASIVAQVESRHEGEPFISVFA
jgi:selenide, water dikinase